MFQSRSFPSAVLFLSFALTGLVLPAEASAQDARLPMSDYLIPEAEEIALARSAAPTNISGQAAVLVLTSRGYEERVPGTNGFTCAVFRSWSNPLAWGFFWNPRIRVPICLNPDASASILPMQLRRTRLVIEGRDGEAVVSGANAGLEAGDYPLPGPTAMAYMMSARQYLSDRAQAGQPHVMFYRPFAQNEQFGGNAFAGPLPFVLEGAGTPYAIVVVATGEPAIEPSPTGG